MGSGSTGRTARPKSNPVATQAIGERSFGWFGFWWEGRWTLCYRSPVKANRANLLSINVPNGAPRRRLYRTDKLRGTCSYVLQTPTFLAAGPADSFKRSTDTQVDDARGRQPTSGHDIIRREPPRGDNSIESMEQVEVKHVDRRRCSHLGNGGGAGVVKPSRGGANSWASGRIAWRSTQFQQADRGSPIVHTRPARSSASPHYLTIQPNTTAD